MAGYVTKKTYDFYPRPPRGGRLRHSSKLQQDKGYFYPRPPRGGRLCIPCACWLCPRFLSTPSARRATAHKCPHCAGLHISIHALREEGDLPWLSLCSAIGKFLSTPSARRATDAPLIWATSLMYFYPRPLRGGRRAKAAIEDADEIFLSTPSARRATEESASQEHRQHISIHALCEEGDCCRWGSSPGCVYFYPRPLRGGRLEAYIKPLGLRLFLSTPSARRATIRLPSAYPPLHISIHALCEEGDAARPRAALHPAYFYPRPLRGGRPDRALDERQRFHFYPRPLRGGRRAALMLRLTTLEFLSTPSARRATCQVFWLSLELEISIHALCEEGDIPPSTADFHNLYFYPRPLRGGRRCQPRPGSRPDQFLSTPSARRATTRTTALSKRQRNFYPRPLRGGRREQQHYRA